MTTFKKIAAALGLAGLVAAQAGTAHANAFVAWQIAGVPWGDTLNVRKFPSSISQKQAAYPNGTVLQMTGTCTGGVDLAEIAGLPAGAQKGEVRYLWCQVWHDPAQNGGYVTGWVYGKFIKPY